MYYVITGLLVLHPEYLSHCQDPGCRLLNSGFWKFGLNAVMRDVEVEVEQVQLLHLEYSTVVGEVPQRHEEDIVYQT